MTAGLRCLFLLLDVDDVSHGKDVGVCGKLKGIADFDVAVCAEDVGLRVEVSEECGIGFDSP